MMTASAKLSLGSFDQQATTTIRPIGRSKCFSRRARVVTIGGVLLVAFLHPPVCIARTARVFHSLSNAQSIQAEEMCAGRIGP